MKWFSLILLLLTSQISYGASQQKEYLQVLENIKQARKALKMSAQSAACDTPDTPQCTFGSGCAKLANRAGDFYLYQDEEGRQVPNLSMQVGMNFIETCTKAKFAEAPVFDPYVYPDQFFDAKKAGGPEKLAKNRQDYEKGKARIDKIFEDSKSKILKVLESRRTAQNQKNMDKMIAKIKSTKMRHLTLKGEWQLAEYGCDSPNAYYDGMSGTVTVCPQFFNMPEAALFSILSHELGHSIDACYAQDNMDGSVNKPDDNPFKDVISCLQSPDSAGVQIPSKQSLIDKINKEQTALKEEMAQEAQEMGEGGENGEANATDAMDANYDDRRKEIADNYENNKYCRDTTENGHMQEIFSDWMASQALAEKVKEIPESGKAREFAAVSQTMFYSLGCENIKQSVANKLKALGGKACQDYQPLDEFLASGTSREEDSHPNPSRRVDRVYYAKPEVRQAMGCQSSDNAKECK